MTDIKTRGVKRLAIERLIPHPDNPRKDLGDISELTESIRTHGVFQNLTVTPAELVDGVEIPDDEKQYYVVVIGHRRLAAAKAAGLTDLPCMDVSMDRKEQLSTMLLENMQRSDLTAYEQAWGFEQMSLLGCSVEEISEKSGFSRTTVRRRLKMAELDHKTLREVSRGRQLSITDFDKLAEIEDIKERNKCLKDIGTANFDSSVSYAIRMQNRKRATPIAKKMLKEIGAQSVSELERYSSKYEQIGRVNLDSWNPDDGLKHSGKEGEQIFYNLTSWGDLYLLRKAQKKSTKKSKAEAEHEKAVADAHGACKQAEEVAYELRKQFVENVKVTQKTVPILLRGAAIGIISSSTLYKGLDRNELIKMMGVDPDGKWDAVRSDTVKAAVAYEENDLIPQIVYASFCDSKTNGYHTGYSKEWPKHDKNLILDALYAWLKMLGYEMSDEEQALQDGTFEAFHRGEKSNG